MKVHKIHTGKNKNDECIKKFIEWNKMIVNLVYRITINLCYQYKAGM